MCSVTMMTNESVNPPLRSGKGIIGMHFICNISIRAITYVCIDELPSNLVHKFCPHWDAVQWPWPRSIPQKSRSHKTFKGQSTQSWSCLLYNLRMHLMDYHLTWYKCCPRLDDILINNGHKCDNIFITCVSLQKQ